MKSILGFTTNSQQPTTPSIQEPTVVEQAPVRSVVRVRFFGSRINYLYYNDKFDLHPGDLVYVAGSMAGHMGRVETVTTKFKIHIGDYKKVTARLDRTLRGTYTQATEAFMVCFDRASISPAQFRGWVIPPREKNKRLVPISAAAFAGIGYVLTDEPDDLVVGDGYRLLLNELEISDDLAPQVLARAKEYVEDHCVKYISVEQETVTAFIQGSDWYELNFKLSDGYVSELYCDCPYPGLCKHAAAVLLILRKLLDQPEFTEAEQFVAVENDFFWEMLSRCRGSVTL